MIEFGKTLREAREAKGLSIADIATKTHMMSSMVENLENEDFSHLPAPIYGRGFIKLYCEVVEIDSAPLVAEFMEICNGNREPAIRERSTAKPVVEAEEPVLPQPPPQTDFHVPEPDRSVPEPEPEPEPIAAEPVESPVPPHKEQLDLFSSNVEPVPPRVEPEIRNEQPEIRNEQPETDFLAPAPAKPEHTFARYASPLREGSFEMPRIAPAIGRWCVVAVILALVAWGVIVGLRALYRATSNTVPEEPEEPEVTTAVLPTAAQPPARTDRTGRKPIDVPPLYID